MKPVVFLLADQGYPPYAQTLIATRKRCGTSRRMVRKFLRATAEDWASYLKNPHGATRSSSKPIRRWRTP